MDQGRSTYNKHIIMSVFCEHAQKQLTEKQNKYTRRSLCAKLQIQIFRSHDPQGRTFRTLKK